MSGYPRFYRPALKNSVDVQLQTAFNDGQWSTVTRLAAQRYKMKKDPYYEVGWPVPIWLHSPSFPFHAYYGLTAPLRI